ncbi:MAG: glycosyltransferase family 39 protein, partial [Armatimonadota bacterium]
MSNSCSPPPTPTEPLADQRPGCKRTLRAGSWVLVLAACGWVMWVGLWVGPIMTQDSESYVNLADSLAQQHTYSLPYVEANALSLQYRGESHTPPPWPPGYPAVTALLVLTTGLPTAAAARWVALAAALVCVLLVYRLCRALGCSPWLAAIGAACFAVAPGTAMVVPSVWSETLFLVPVLLALICLAKAREIGWRQALLIGLLAAAAGLVRYVAVGLILAIAICILMRARREPILKKLWLLALSAGLPTAAMAGWFIRNRLVTGSFTGHQIPPCDSFAVNLS